MSKRVTSGSKPTARPAPETADEWVNNRGGAEEMKRLTFDIPASLHRRIKVACALKGVTMVEELRELLNRQYPE